MNINSISGSQATSSLQDLIQPKRKQSVEADGGNDGGADAVKNIQQSGEADGGHDGGADAGRVAYYA